MYDDALRERILVNVDAHERHIHDEAELRPAAVVIAVLPDEQGRACFVLTRRADKLNRHAGQWALPGGRLDEGETATTAALRELREEVGVDLPETAVLGILDDYATRSGFVISPLVVWCPPDVRLDPDPGEVAAAYRVPLRDLDHPDVPELRTIPESDRPVISVPLLGTHIHAPTAAVLYQFREVALRGIQTRVAHYEQPVFAWR